jgi:integrase
MPWTRLLQSGRYQGLYRDAAGKEQSAGTFTQAAEAMRKAGALEAEQRETQPFDAGGAKIQWGAWFEMWHESRSLSYSTDTTYRSTAANHVLPEWENTKLMDIKPMNVARWTAKMTRQKKSPYVIRNALMLFKTSLNAAVDDQRLRFSPAKKIPYPDLPQGTERFLTPDEVEAIGFCMDGMNATILWTAVQTGMRFGEISGLHWSRVNFETRTIDVVEQYDQKAKVIKGYPKDKDKRTIPMPADMVGMLRRYKNVTESHRAKTCGQEHAYGRCSGDLVFRGARLAPVTSKEWGRGVWHKCRTMAEVDYARPHDLRHTYASWLLQQGVSIPELALMMGHSKWEVTQKYAHLSSESMDSVRDALSRHRRTAGRTADPHPTTPYEVGSQPDEQAV